MKFLIFFLIGGIFGELTTVLPELEPETLTDLPYGTVEDFAGVAVTLQARDNELESEVESSVTDDACQEENMEWVGCGPRCYQTCAFQPRGARQGRAVCELVTNSQAGCYPGCFCKSGFVRLHDKCILPVDCPTRSCILSNEEHQQCGTPCPITCDSHSYLNEIEARCPTDICIRGCFCKAGFVRSATGLCVLPTRCPRPVVI